MKPNRFRIARQIVVRAMHQVGQTGPCSRPHGHDYRVEVILEGEMDQRTGLVFSRSEFDEILQRHLVDKYDGSNLNEFFKVTSGEALAREFFSLLEKEFPKGLLHQVRVQETVKNYFEFPALPGA